MDLLLSLGFPARSQTVLQGFLACAGPWCHTSEPVCSELNRVIDLTDQLNSSDYQDLLVLEIYSP